MADDTKHIEHTIRGYIPKEAWAKFIQEHFVAEDAAKPAERRSPTMNSICTGLGCPGTFHGGTLSSCSINTERDGSTTIHCHYSLVAAK
ncbi:MAG TPA: hypothetical protein VK593_02020 [Edaphobacter sp.]|nr:hypothetical protein [Edaphobacter sp.]